MEKKAKIYTYSVIYSSTENFSNKTPYLIALLKDNRGNKKLSFIEGYDEHQDIEIGQTVIYLKDDDKGRAIYKLQDGTAFGRL